MNDTFERAQIDAQTKKVWSELIKNKFGGKVGRIYTWDCYTCDRK